jgi:ribosomal protein S18 acetylase RimI-like enzyme
LNIRAFSPADESAVIELWQRCGLLRPWNNPHRDIERKLKINPELFRVGLIDGQIVAAGMGGYEGHRGWVNYLAVDPTYRRKGLGRQMMQTLEEKLLALGCPKINIQVRSDNLTAKEFYTKLGFKTDDVESMGKRLLEDG